MNISEFKKNLLGSVFDDKIIPEIKRKIIEIGFATEVSESYSEEINNKIAKDGYCAYLDTQTTEALEFYKGLDTHKTYPLKYKFPIKNIGQLQINIQ